MTKKKQNLIDCEKEDSNNKYRSYLQFSSPAILLRPAWGTVYKKKKIEEQRVLYLGMVLHCGVHSGGFEWAVA